MPLDFLDGSTVLEPLAAGADPDQMQPEEEYVEQEEEAAAPDTVCALCFLLSRGKSSTLLVGLKQEQDESLRIQCRVFFHGM